jgi:diketogulonate reductase-like aldo/keto reductase
MDGSTSTRDGGALLPRILYGTAWKKKATADCVARALRAGFRGIDTACQPKHYYEPGVGEGIAQFLGSEAGQGLTRSALYLQTKFTPLSGQDPERLPYDAQAAPAEQVRQSVRVSLTNLRTDYLDCLVLHSPIKDSASMDEVWRALEDAATAGQVRSLGISNCYELDTLRALFQKARTPPVVLQNRFYADTAYDVALRGFCAAHGMVYQSFWTLSANKQVLKQPAIMAPAKRYGVTPAQVFFRYVTQEGMVPITGTQSDAHMHDDLSIFAFELTPGEVVAIRTLLALQPATD